jgi:hypothetical protein
VPEDVETLREGATTPLRFTSSSLSSGEEGASAPLSFLGSDFLGLLLGWLERDSLRGLSGAEGLSLTMTNSSSSPSLLSLALRFGVPLLFEAA